MNTGCIQVKPEDIANLLYEVYNVPNGICKHIKNMVQRLESIDNANPSEALECLEWLIKNYIGNDYYVYEEELTTIKQALIKSQEQDFNYKNIVIPFFDELANLLGTNDIDEMLDKIKEQKQVLEIIKKKSLTNCNIALVKDSESYKVYCKQFDYFLNKYNESPNGFEITKEDLLTQEEFDLLKRYIDGSKS